VKPRQRAGWKDWLRRLFLVAFGAVALPAFFLIWSNVAAWNASHGKLHDRLADVPSDSVGLVFGCNERYQGRENLYFRYRIDAAAALWKTGRLKYLIVSGDNRDHYYNKPERMKAALMKEGVPAEKIVCDYAGLRTLDSVVRAKEVFGLKDVVFISQSFQNQRAGYIAEANGLAFSGFNARDVSGRSGLKVKAREVLARAKMWLDVQVLHTRPVYSRDRNDLAS